MKNIKKAVIFILTAAMLMSVSFTCAYADDAQVKRVVCTMYKDAAFGRGFNWYTVSKADSDLQLVKTADYDGNFDSAVSYSGSVTYYRGQYAHSVAVTDLLPDTSYTYRVGDASKNIWSEPFSFFTDDNDDTFSFITIADVQASNKESFEKAYLAAKAAYEVMPDAEFTVNLGDYVNDNTNDEWDWYFEAFKDINGVLTHVPVAGNHDGNITNKLNTFCFKNMFCLDESDNQSLEGVYYSFDCANAHFAVINTNDMYPMSQAQLNWLKNDMSSTDAQWKIILSHRSLYSAGKNINKPDTVVMRDVLLPIIDELGIDMVYAGHDHMYLRTAPVYADKKTQTTFVTQIYNGTETVFALNPVGTVYTLPSTAGTKRYEVNENALSPILDVADKAFATKETGGCFCTTQIDGDKLIYKAYCVDDESGEITLVDEYAIMKTQRKDCIDKTELETDIGISVSSAKQNLITAVMSMLKSYIMLLFQVIL